jgi:hypothetical protein
MASFTVFLFTIACFSFLNIIESLPFGDRDDGIRQNEGFEQNGGFGQNDGVGQNERFGQNDRLGKNRDFGQNGRFSSDFDRYRQGGYEQRSGSENTRFEGREKREGKNSKP